MTFKKHKFEAQKYRGKVHGTLGDPPKRGIVMAVPHDPDGPLMVGVWGRWMEYCDFVDHRRYDRMSQTTIRFVDAVVDTGEPPLF